MSTGDEARALSIEVQRGDADAEELAALIAVVSEAYADEVESATAADDRPDAWERSARAPRPVLRRDVPWGRFAG